MQIEAKKHVKRHRAFTLVELILVVGTIALVAGALVGLISNSYEDWKLGSNRSTLLQDGQAAMEQMVRILRQAKGFSAVSSPNDTPVYITFTDVDGELKEFRLDSSTNEIKYGEPDDLSALTGSVNQLVFTCYDIEAKSLDAPVQVRNIRAVHIEMTLVDPVNSSLTFKLSGRVFCPTDFKCVVINEFMYHPNVKGSDEKYYEWVELYNFGDSAVDLAGWTIQTGTEDTLVSHPTFGDDSMIIPAGGYAVITTNNTKVTGVNPNAIWLSCGDSQIGNGLGNNSDTVTITDGSATIDSVTYDDDWGADGNGESLARIDPQGPSDDPNNWTPQDGTPGSVNPKA